MNSSLLREQIDEQFEQKDIFESNLFLNDNNLLLQNGSIEESSFLLKDIKLDENSLINNQIFPFEESDLLSQSNRENFSNFDNMVCKKDQNGIKELSNSINNITDNDNCSCIQLCPQSMLTTSNSNMINNIGVKNEDFIYESEKEIKGNNTTNKSNNLSNLSDQTFKCDFLENISLGLDEKEDSYYYSNKKEKIDLNNPTSLLAAIINLMKEKGPIDIKSIISSLENKKDTFRKTNGSKYKQDFNKLVKTTLNTPDIFFKEGNKYFFIEDKTAYYLKKKRERGMERIFMNLNKKNTLLPINVKIQLDKVNVIIKKMEKKYKSDKKYKNVMICIDMFKGLIKKYLYLVKMEKVNSLYELSVLNEKIIDICHTLERIEKGELFFKTNENIINKKANEYNNQNNKNIMFVDGDNNQFNEPPNNIG